VLWIVVVYSSQLILIYFIVGLLSSLSSMNVNGNSIVGSIPLSTGIFFPNYFFAKVLVTRMSSRIGSLTVLTSLDFGNNKMTGTIPSTIGCLCIYECATDITHSHYFSFAFFNPGLLTLMISLNLNSNMFRGALPTTLGMYLNIEMNW